jgi:hypothetical protein
MNEYSSLTELGRLYGVSSHVVGRWLKGLGLRTENGRPSPEAHAQGYVAQRPSRHPGTYFWIWHTARTTAILDGMRYPRAVLDSAVRERRPGGS